MIKDNIKRVVKAHEWSVKAVAAQMGISQSALSQQINNESITCVNALRVCAIVGCSISELLTNEERNAIKGTCPRCGAALNVEVSIHAAEEK